MLPHWNGSEKVKPTTKLLLIRALWSTSQPSRLLFTRRVSVYSSVTYKQQANRRAAAGWYVKSAFMHAKRWWWFETKRLGRVRERTKERTSDPRTRPAYWNSAEFGVCVFAGFCCCRWPSLNSNRSPPISPCFVSIYFLLPFLIKKPVWILKRIFSFKVHISVWRVVVV